MKIKKQIKYIFGTAVFLAIAAVLLTLTTYVMRPTDKDFFRARVAGFYAEDRDSLDVVGFGSSALYRYLNSPLLWKQQGIRWSWCLNCAHIWGILQMWRAGRRYRMLLRPR